MTRKRKPQTAAKAPRFLDRLREALSRYADGVHALSPPATPAALAAARARVGVPVAPSLAEIYELADGVWLFDETVRVVPLAELAVVDGRFLACGIAEGDRLLCDAEGHIYLEDDDGDRVLAAGSLEEALLVWLGREALLLDGDGEWREVFDDAGDVLPAVQRKRNEVARKRAPDAARWLLEAAEIALEQGGNEGEAEARLAEAIAADPEAAAPHEILGSLLLARGVLDEGARELTLAAEHGSASRRAERAAAAAAACRSAGDEPRRARMAQLAIETEPKMAQRLAEEADAALEAGRLDDADRLSALAAAVAGSADLLPPRLRMRQRLRTI